MDKAQQDLIKAILSLVKVIDQQNKTIEKQTSILKDNIEAIKELRTRLTSVANAISEGGKVVETK